MIEHFSELLNLLKLSAIRFIDSHETVLDIVYPEEGTEIQIETETQFPDETPHLEKDSVGFQPKYIISFSNNGKVFFRVEYILLVVFSSENTERCFELLQDKEIKDLFLQKQLNKTLWPILRGTILDAFNRHSLQPVVLPWII